MTPQEWPDSRFLTFQRPLELHHGDVIANLARTAGAVVTDLLTRPCRVGWPDRKASPNEGKISSHSDVLTRMESEHSRGRVRVEPSHKRIRAYLGQQLVIDTTHPLLVWEIPYYPTYYIPMSDVRAKLIPTGGVEHSPSRGDAHIYDVNVARAMAPGAARRYPVSPLEEIREAVRLDWNAMDEWFEEDEPVYVHPRDPYTRVDILASSRHIQVIVDGVVVADSHQPRILFETGLPPRFYLPLTDIRLDLLTPSRTQSKCPYKGTAGYWHLDVNGHRYDDLVWIYRTPLPESQKIAGLAAFYNERVDLYVEGALQERVRTKFS